MKHQGRYLSWLLRHGARQNHLRMDPAGWVSTHEVLADLGIEPDELAKLVREDGKQRFQLRPDPTSADDLAVQIRACQGHSYEGAPVEEAALEASWAEDHDEGDLWHATKPELVEIIRERGLHPIKRTHVHLAPSPDSKVGKRNRAALLEVSREGLLRKGLAVFRAWNSVLLVRAVPPDCIVGARTN